MEDRLRKGMSGGGALHWSCFRLLPEEQAPESEELEERRDEEGLECPPKLGLLSSGKLGLLSSVVGLSAFCKEAPSNIRAGSSGGGFRPRSSECGTEARLLEWGFHLLPWLGDESADDMR